MRKFFLIAILFLIIIPFVNSQNDSLYLPNTGIYASYMGSIVYPGFKIGIERPYKITQVNILKKKRTKTFYKERYLGFSLGMYYHPTFHTNFFLQSEWQIQRQKSCGLYYGFAPGLGISRTFYDGATFRIDDNGNILKVPLAGNFYGLASLSGTIGYNFAFKTETNLKVYLKPSVILMFPYNKIVYFRPTFEIGAVFNIADFWKSNPKTKTKTKDRTKKSVKMD
jgi:hypothetical protein